MASPNRLEFSNLLELTTNPEAELLGPTVQDAAENPTIEIFLKDHFAPSAYSDIFRASWIDLKQGFEQQASPFACQFFLS